MRLKNEIILFLASCGKVHSQVTKSLREGAVFGKGHRRTQGFCPILNTLSPDDESTCWEQSETEGCDNQACQQAVCECDDYCCNKQWDLSCSGYFTNSETWVKNNFFVSGCSASILCCEYEDVTDKSKFMLDTINSTGDMEDSSSLLECESDEWHAPSDSNCWLYNDQPDDDPSHMVGDQKGCDFEPCESKVCECDSYCCETSWDLSCRGIPADDSDPEDNYFIHGCSASILCCEPADAPKPKGIIVGVGNGEGSGAIIGIGINPPQAVEPPEEENVEAQVSCIDGGWYAPPYSSCWLYNEQPDNNPSNMIGDQKGCDHDLCEQAVCECDSYCCDVSWDVSCRGIPIEDGSPEDNYFVGGCSAAILCCEPADAPKPEGIIVGIGSNGEETGAIIGGTNGEGSGGIIGGTNGEGGIIGGTNGEGAIIGGTNGEGAIIGGTNGEVAIIGGTNGEDAIIGGTNGEGAIIGGTNGDGSGAIIGGTNGEGSGGIIGGTNGEGAIIGGTNGEGSGGIIGGTNGEGSGAIIGGTNGESGGVIGGIGIGSGSEAVQPPVFEEEPVIMPIEPEPLPPVVMPIPEQPVIMPIEPEPLPPVVMPIPEQPVIMPNPVPELVTDCKTGNWYAPTNSNCWSYNEQPNSSPTSTIGNQKGCDYGPCEQAVCACDSYCCDVSWDLSCRGIPINQASAEDNYFVGGCSAAILCCEPVNAPKPDIPPEFIEIPPEAILPPVIMPIEPEPLPPPVIMPIEPDPLPPVVMPIEPEPPVVMPIQPRPDVIIVKSKSKAGKDKSVVVGGKSKSGDYGGKKAGSSQAVYPRVPITPQGGKAGDYGGKKAGIAVVYPDRAEVQAVYPAGKAGSSQAVYPDRAGVQAVYPAGKAGSSQAVYPAGKKSSVQVYPDRPTNVIVGSTQTTVIVKKSGNGKKR